MSTTAKVLLVLTALFGGGLVVCCGACGYFAYLIMPVPTEVAAEIDVIRDQMVQIQLPPDYVPKQGASKDSWIMSFRLAHYERTDGKGRIMFLQIIPKIGDQKNMQQQLKQANADAEGEFHHLTDMQTETKTYELNGQTVNFEFIHGEDASSDRVMHQVRGDFTGANGPVTLTVEAEDDVWNEEEIDAMLKSIR